MNWLLSGAAVLLCLGGILAYAGVWRSWALSPLGYGVGFMLLYVGIALFTIQIAGVLLDAGALWLGIFFYLIAVVSMITAVVSMLWLPRFLTPEWFNQVRGRGTRRQ